MRSPAWIAALLLHATLLAQAPLDLPALGKSIDPGDCPEVYAKIPANYREAAAEAFGDATPASLRLALERAEPESNAWILAAVAILARSDDEPRPPRRSSTRSSPAIAAPSSGTGRTCCRL